VSQRIDTALSVLVMPSGEAGELLDRAVIDWYHAGLLRPAVWIRPEDVNVAEGRAPAIRAVMRSGTSESEGDLFAFLGTRRLALVRVVMIQLLQQPGSFDALQIERAMGVQFWVNESVPAPRLAADGSEVVGTEVRTVNLVTGVTGLNDMPPEVVPRGWDVAAVTSPEDRPDPGRANAFVRAETNLQGVAILSAAVVANLIPGATAGPFDAIHGDASVVLGKALVIRSTARALVGDVVVEQLAGTALSRALTSSSMGVADPEHFALGERDQIVDDLLDWLDEVDQGATAPSSSAGQHELRGQVMTVKNGLGVLLRFAAAALGVMVSGLWRVVVRRSEAAATRAIVGEGAGVQLVLAPVVGLGLAQDLAEIDAADIRLRQEALASAERRSARVATQELWTALRDVAHSVLDGGAFPAGAPKQHDGSRPVLLREVGDVAPSPADGFVVHGSTQPAIGAVALSACSPAEALDGEAKIAEALTTAHEAVANARQAVEAASAPAEDEDARNAKIASARTDLASAEARLRAVMKVESDFREWLERRKGALFWRFRDRNVTRLARAGSAEQRAKHAATQPSEIEGNALMALRRRFLWQSWTAVLIAIGIGGWMVYTADTRTADLVNELGTVIGCLVIALIALIVAWYQAVLAALHKYELAAAARAHAAEEFGRQNADRRRFEDVERGLELWCDVVGWSLHAPWSDEASDGGATDVRDVLLSMPSAVQLAEPTLDDREMAQASRAAAAEITTAGWRSRAYDRLVALFSDLSPDADEAEAIAAVERLDTPHGREELRLFRDELATGQVQRLAAQVVIDEIEGFLRQERLALTTLTVRPIGDSTPIGHLERDTDFLARALVPASPFAQETWSEQAKVQGAHQDVVSKAWARNGPAAIAAVGIAVSPVDDGELKDSRLIDVVVRCDVSEWVDVTKLRLFSQLPTDPSEEWSAGPGDSVFI
jgi:uncharacterized membrane protein